MKTLLTTLFATAMLALSCNASAVTIANVGNYDTLVTTTDIIFANPNTLPNSGAEEAWIEGVLGFDVTYTQLSDTDSDGDNWVSVSDGVDGDYAFDLSPYNPEYFLVKVGGGGGTGTDETHYLFDNAVSMEWAFLNLEVFGDGVSLTNIGVVSHVGVSDGNCEGPCVNTVPIPAAVWLFGSGLIGLVAVARRKA